MAESTGIQSTQSAPSGGGGGLTAKKNRKWIYLGGAGIAVLLLGHKGSNASGNSPNDPNAALQSPSGDSNQYVLPPAGDAPTTIDSGGGTVNEPGSNIAVTTPPSGPTTPQTTASDPGIDNTAGADPENASPELAAADTSLDAATVASDAAVIASNEAPKHGRPKPAPKGGGHHHPSHGATVQGHTGQTVHGRSFPGAKSHTIGPARRVGGNVHQDVTVHFGGHSETHTSVNQGSHWIDNTKGRNPPSRGPQNVHPVAVERRPEPPRPEPRPEPRPAPRPAPAPVHRGRRR